MEESKSYKSFTDLSVWKASRDYKNGVYQVARMLPKDEHYRMGDQLIRASRSINSNIAEGYGRFTYRDQTHFCMQARGSLFESVNHLIDAQDCGYITDEEFDTLKNKANEVERLLNGYIAWLRSMNKS